jgi:hypothetical protein
MGTFDTFADSPDQINIETREISLRAERTGTNVKLTWNIPTPIAGCAGSGAYNGFIILYGTTPQKPHEFPIEEGVIYKADSTGDVDLHTGDKIKEHLVVGAEYKDATVNEITVTDIAEDAPLYFTLLGVDKQLRYSNEGAHAYSQNSGNDSHAKPDSPAEHNFVLTEKVELSDGTGFDGTKTGKLWVALGEEETYEVNVDGSKIQTYQQLVDELNNQFLLLDNPPQNIEHPNSGGYYYNNGVLYQWDGNTHNVVDGNTATISNEDPATSVAVNDYWYNTDTEVLHIWDGSMWPVVSGITTATVDPQNPEASGEDVFWYNLSNQKGYHRKPGLWCSEHQTYVSGTNPATDNTLDKNTFWYNTATEVLQKWSEKKSKWELAVALVHDNDPLLPANNQFWVNDSDNRVYAWDGSSYVEYPGVAKGDEPAVPVTNQYWLDTDEMVLSRRNATNTDWIEINAVYWGSDPSVEDACELWWRATDDTLLMRDTVNTQWVNVSDVYQQEANPEAPNVYEDGDIWFDSVNQELYVWSCNEFTKAKNTFIKSSDPTNVTVGTIWYNPNIKTFYKLNGGSTWDELVVFFDNTAPNDRQNGDQWYDTDNDVLYTWNGASWSSTSFNTKSFSPKSGEQYYNSVENVLYTWNNVWVATTPKVSVELFEKKNLLFKTKAVGSCAAIEIYNEPLEIGATDCYIFDVIDGKFNLRRDGFDGIDKIPQFERMDVGTDGTTDQRRELADSMRAQLGYPVIDVELTKYQIDTAITGALESLRKRSSGAYTRNYFKLRLDSRYQNYYLNDRKQQTDRIVTVMGVQRMHKAFLNQITGGDVFADGLMQQLYYGGSYDLLTYDLIAQYTEQIEQIFATRVQFEWDEFRRNLRIFQTSHNNEIVLLDCMTERTEQDMINDRYLRGWIEKYAIAECKMMLAQIRGKFATLPGAGGGVQLNAAELQAQAEQEKEQLYMQIDDMLTEPVEMLGWGAGATIG